MANRLRVVSFHLLSDILIIIWMLAVIIYSAPTTTPTTSTLPVNLTAATTVPGILEVNLTAATTVPGILEVAQNLENNASLAHSHKVIVKIEAVSLANETAEGVSNASVVLEGLGAFTDVEGNMTYTSTNGSVSVEPEEIIAGVCGDELLTPAEQKLVGETNCTQERRKRKLIPKNTFLWPDGVVPFRLDRRRRFRSSRSRRKARAAIHRAMNLWMDNTCIQFVRFASKKAKQLGVTHNNFINIGNGRGCRSVVGYGRLGGQEVTLSDPRCVKVGIIAHELGHVMGLFHEQSRTDRVTYVNIQLGNIRSRYRHNFRPLKTKLLAPYDLGSIMHYGSKYFSRNRKGKTIRVLDRRLEFLIGQRIAPSFYDYETINKGYKCNEKCNPKIKCENDGYQDKHCRCVCPGGLSGDTCSKVNKQISLDCGGYYALKTRDEVIEIRSPGYPTAYSYTECVWFIQSPLYTRMNVTLTMKGITPSLTQHHCSHWLEIRYNLLGQIGPSYCGHSTNDKRDNINTVKNTVMFIFNSMYPKITVDKGFRATIHILDENLCKTAQPCHNGATCTAHVTDMFKCQCVGGFDGKLCEIINTPVTCNFDTHSTGVLVQSRRDNFDWKLNKGKTQSRKTGPTTDASGGGYYLFIEASKPQTHKQIARMEMRNVKAGTKCLSLQYHMYGSGMGTLAIWFQTKSGIDSSQITRSGDKGKAWHTMAITVNSPETLTLVFEAERGKTYKSDLAIDDIKLVDGDCSKADGLIRVAEVRAGESLSCTFEQGLCSFVQDQRDDFDWQIKSGSTTTSKTGPTTDRSGTGQYIYIRASEAKSTGSVARLISPIVFHTRPSCLTFWYHAYGSDLGRLSVLMNNTITHHVRSLWATAGAITTDNGWNKITIEVECQHPFRVVFEGAKGNGTRGDYAVDDFLLASGQCIGRRTAWVPFNCTFEEGLCDMVVGTDISMHKAHRHHFGVQFHTVLKSSVLFIPIGNGNMWITTPEIKMAGKICLEFWYKLIMTSNHSNWLKVHLLTDQSSKPDLIWKTNTRSNWRKIGLQFKEVKYFKIKFTVDAWLFYCSCLLDNLAISPGTCSG